VALLGVALGGGGLLAPRRGRGPFRRRLAAPLPAGLRAAIEQGDYGEQGQGEQGAAHGGSSIAAGFAEPGRALGKAQS
jgi:hypothetical protein